MIDSLQPITDNPLTQPRLKFDGENFQGLMPLIAEKMGGIGTPKEPVLPPELDRRSIDPVEVSDFQKVVREDEETTTPAPEPEPEVVRPESTINTDEEQAIEDNIIDEMGEGQKTFTPEGTMNNFEMPEGASVAPTITAEIQNGATFTNNTNKSLTIVSTNEEPVDVIVEGTGNVYLRGDYNDIYLDSPKLPVSSSIYPNVYGKLSIEDQDDTTTGVSVSVNFVGDDCEVVYLGEAPLTITDGNTADTGSPTIYAPNATVNMGGKYGDVVATVSEDTLILKAAFHANSLTVKKGNVKIYGTDINDFADEVSIAGSWEPMSWNIPDDGTISKMTSNAGVYNITQDIETTSVIGFGVIASGKYRYNLNGHNVSTTNKNYLAFLRGTVTVDVYGDGGMSNVGDGYGFWVSSQDATLNIHGGIFSGNTHTLYAEKGTINVYGGEFDLTNGETADKDENGHYRFLLNCLDASYQSGIAKINVYGGKFHNFNPENCAAEGPGTNFVAPGYHAVEVEENVFEVVPNEE